MSENFPFDTADEFLAAFIPQEKKMPEDHTVTAQHDVAIHVPAMPDRTPVQQSARLASLAVLGLAVYTQDRWVLIAAVAGAVAIECSRIFADARIRGARNVRLMEENTQAIASAAEIKQAHIHANPGE